MILFVALTCELCIVDSLILEIFESFKSRDSRGSMIEVFDKLREFTRIWEILCSNICPSGKSGCAGHYHKISDYLVPVNPIIPRISRICWSQQKTTIITTKQQQQHNTLA